MMIMNMMSVVVITMVVIIDVFIGEISKTFKYIMQI